MEESYPNRIQILESLENGRKLSKRVENTVGKGKLIVTSNFSFSHRVFKRLVSQGRQKVSLCGNGFKEPQRIMYRCTGYCNITEMTLRLALNTKQCINQPTAKHGLKMIPFDFDINSYWLKVKVTVTFNIFKFSDQSLSG